MYLGRDLEISAQYPKTIDDLYRTPGSRFESAEARDDGDVRDTIRRAGLLVRRK
jgi:hypothetical protein